MFEQAIYVFDSAVRAVTPTAKTFEHVRRHRLLENASRISVVGVGKAAISMAKSLSININIESGHLTVPIGYAKSDIPELTQFEIVESDHPVPGQFSSVAVQSVVDFVTQLDEEKAVIVLLSGGGSSLWGAPIPGLSFQHYADLASMLAGSNLAIDQLNAVRSRISRLSGGGLLSLIHPRSCIAYVVSDVPGDDLSVVASGPLSPSRDSMDAIEILKSLGVDVSTLALVEKAMHVGNDEDLTEPEFVTVGSNRMAIEAAASAATALGFEVQKYPNAISGEASAVARSVVDGMTQANSQPTCRIYGGESTVTVTGAGRGGRNQELALAAALHMKRRNTPGVLLSGGTDGIDGPTSAAGAIVDRSTIDKIGSLGRSGADHLRRNDSFSFFKSTDNHLVTGPTHTNVMDLVITLQP